MWGALEGQTNGIKQHSLHISAFVLTVVIETIAARMAYFLFFWLRTTEDEVTVGNE